MQLLIVITSLVYPFFAMVIASGQGRSSGLELLLYFPVFAAVNPFIVVFAANVCEAIYRWAYPNTGKWSKDAQMFISAFWPFTLPLYLIIFFMLGVINRSFRS